MARKDRFSRIRKKPLTPTSGMREYLGDSSFGMFMAVSVVFAFLHQRVITSELQNGSGGLWCSLGITALLCLAVSVFLAFFGAKTRLLPAIAPILGVGGIIAAIAMFAVIIVRRMVVFSGSMLGVLQEISMLAFLGSWAVCLLMLMLTGIGMKVSPPAGMVAAICTIIALILFVVRAMYIFSSLVTALSRDLLLPDGEMADSIQWVLRSVAPGSEAAQKIYFDRLLDSVGIALLMMCCVPLALRFHGFFSEQAVILRNNKEIPRPTDYHQVYVGYDEYTQDDIPSAPERPAEESFTITSQGYYVEKKVTDRAKFKRHERTAEIPEETEQEEQTEVNNADVSEPAVEEAIPDYDPGQAYDHYIPGEGWSNFLERTTQNEKEEQENAQRSKPKRVTPVRADRPAPDPKSEDFWYQYKK